MVIVFVHATKPSGGGGAGVADEGDVHVVDGLQLVTVVVPGSIGAGVGQTIMQWMPVVTEVREQPASFSSAIGMSVRRHDGPTFAVDEYSLTDSRVRRTAASR